VNFLVNETLKLLQMRKSIRNYSDEPILPAEKQAILDAAMRAPTAGNMMLYSILDITDQALKEKLAETCDHQPFIAKAPLVLIFCADYRRWMRKFAAAGCDNGNPLPVEEGNLLLACNDAIIAAQTAVIAAESLGIGSCYIGDVLEQAETHIELLQLPENVIPISMVVFGKPTKAQKERKQLSRFPQEMIVFENRYQELTPEQLDQFAADRDIPAFYARKHASSFMEEMNRSARALIAHWLKK
jgi:nitroreductase